LCGRGDETPKGPLTFDIEVSDKSSVRGWGPFKRRTIEGWTRIGRLTFAEGVASQNGDSVLHFHHPAWRADRNDPASVFGSGRRVENEQAFREHFSGVFRPELNAVEARRRRYRIERTLGALPSLAGATAPPFGLPSKEPSPEAVADTLDRLEREAA